MARPSPIIILETKNADYISTEVLESDGVYAIYYKDRPIAIRHRNSLVDNTPSKYKKTTFNNVAHGFNRVEKLNKQFNTQSFELRILTQSETVTRDIVNKER
tara:strand:- start:5532 stop:5837 length:306 start_codon:yes stop_codon:yes gene_type:complete